MADDTYASYSSERLTSSVSKIAADLRQLADDIEGACLPAGAVGATPRHTYYVQHIQHKIVWAIANLSTEYLPAIAANADMAELEEVMAMGGE